MRVISFFYLLFSIYFIFVSVNRILGESNVYTLGNIGAHRIVSTKLPSVGSSREAMTAAGNTTTRLLGTFQKVDYVFIIGVAGGVPHYTDFKKHVRLGDVVISSIEQNRLFNGYAYILADVISHIYSIYIYYTRILKFNLN